MGNPPIQVFPSRNGKEARNIVKAPEGYWLVAIDMAQIEARIVAVAANDIEFMKMIWDDYDIHMDWAIRISKTLKMNLDEKGLAKFRKVIKNQWVFPLIYGSSQDSAEIGLEAPKGSLTKDFQLFWEMCAGVKDWQLDQLEFYKEYGYVQNLFGRRRYMPLSKNEIFNSPIQSSASDIVTDAMNRLSKLAYKLKKPQYQPIWNIHDDLGFYIPDETLEEDIRFISEQMVCIPYKFVNVPIGVEVSVGTLWGELEEIVKYNTLDFNPDFAKRRAEVLG
jgi:DNA polymerase-1